MTRFRATAEGDVPFTAEEEAQADAEQAAYEAERLPRVKDAVWELIKAERERRNAGGVKVGANWYHSDATSRVQWLGLKDSARDILAAGGSTSSAITIFGQQITWQSLSGPVVPVDVALALAVVQAVKERDALSFLRAAQHRAVLYASATPEAYDFSIGWPLIFGE